MAEQERLELWAGVECTVNRVGDRYGDQLARGGHAERDDDLDRLAALGVRALRQPVLWERVAPDGLARADWGWVDRRLERLRALGIRPIVTLLHHGSGPRDTSLLDPSLPGRLAEFAHAVAERHPWVEDWTPVNEPLTTARFSALYGLWYPHARDDRSFARAVVTQIRGVCEAMRAVRAVNPAARLVQTEDLGKTHAVRTLAYQARFENERRWLTFDLLAGRLGPDAAMWRFLHRKGGVPERELASFADAPCPPDLLGVNHYLTSERFLDRRLARYPESTHGGNGRHRYADVEAVRVLAAGPDGPARLLREAWTRYGRPIAVTECHLGCTREQQMRWLRSVWEAADAARAEGVDVRAVTAWSAFGAFDWASLLTRDEGHYEPGTFDVRAPTPRPTALASMMRDLADRGSHDHPALDGPGWWETPARLTYPPAGRIDRRRALHAAPPPAYAGGGAWSARRRPLRVVGARGMLGGAIVRACEVRQLAYHAAARSELELLDGPALARVLDDLRPWAVVSAAGYTRVDDAEGERDACWRDNVCAPAALARACATRGVPLVTFSSDLVFDGALERPYVERDTPAPLGACGAAHAEAERAVLDAHERALVVRTAALFDPVSERGFVTDALRALAADRPFVALADVTHSPTYAPALADAALDLLVDGERGVWHVANHGAVTWYELAQMAAAAAGVSSATLVPVALDDAGLAAPRPRRTPLASERGQLLDDVERAVRAYVDARRRARGPQAWAGHPEPAAPSHLTLSLQR
jgi:dTDP-4-dehydrorhamnose reductase